MANYTPNISLKKPLPSDNVSLSDINTNYDKIDSEFGGVLLRVYPVGSIYMSVNSTSPAELFGGTWEEFGKGRTVVGVDTTQAEFNTVEKTGGAKTHTLTISELASHAHPLSLVTYNGPGRDNTYVAGCSGDSGLGGANDKLPVEYRQADPTGGNQPHNNLQPYITCYMWKRVA